MSITLPNLLAVAEDAARQAGAKLKAAFGETVTINESSQHDIKIELDVQTQTFLNEFVLAAFPDHTVLGEESGSGNEGQGYEWIIDPIDGTVNFTVGIPHFCVSIACRLNGKGLVGVIYDPMRDECFTAMVGGGTKLNGKPIHASTRANLSECILSCGFSKSPETVKKCLELYQFYGPRTRKLRAMGSAALYLAYVAAGRIDAYIEQGIKTWDIAAGQILVEEAGGKVEMRPLAEKHHFHIKAWNGVVDLPMA